MTQINLTLTGATKRKEKAVVVFSGGQDSTTCLLLALDQYEEVTALCFKYKQLHTAETIQAELIAKKLGVEFKVLFFSALADIGNSALLNSSNLDINGQHSQDEDLPATFVPNRNAVFLTLAHAYAQSIGATAVFTGVGQADYSGYPDCRDEFIKALNKALNIGSGAEIEIITPLMFLNKAQIFELADVYNGLELVIKESLTCYRGDLWPNYWGMGCGDCPACKLRIDGYNEFIKNIGGV